MSQIIQRTSNIATSSQYILLILVFVNKNREMFLSNSEIHSINTRYNQNLHMPTTNLTMVQKGYCFLGVGFTIVCR